MTAASYEFSWKGPFTPHQTMIGICAAILLLVIFLVIFGLKSRLPERGPKHNAVRFPKRSRSCIAMVSP